MQARTGRGALASSSSSSRRPSIVPVLPPPRARRRQWQHQSEGYGTTIRSSPPLPRAGSTGQGGESATTATAAAAASAPALPSLPTYADVAAAARARGMVLERETRGPFYRIDLYEGEDMARRRAERQQEKRRRWRERQGSGAAAAPSPPPPPLPVQRELLATTDGFCVPPPLGGYVHCDTLRIPQRATLGEDEDAEEGAPDGAISPKTPTSALGLMPLVGCAVLAHARELACTRAEILAIDDDPQQHARLVTYYRYFGFRPKHRVGGQGFFVDLPHLLVWGGEGLRMDLDVDATLARWGRALFREREGGR